MPKQCIAVDQGVSLPPVVATKFGVTQTSSKQTGFPTLMQESYNKRDENKTALETVEIGELLRLIQLLQLQILFILLMLRVLRCK